MAKRYDDDIEVAADPGPAALPVGFTWRGRRYEIDQHLASWLEGGEWWDAAAARDRLYYRVLARPAGVVTTGEIDSDGRLPVLGAVYEIYRDRARGRWRLVRLWD